MSDASRPVVTAAQSALERARALAAALGDGWELTDPAAASEAAPVAPAAPLSREAALAVLETVPDPEIPVISVVELGIVRDVEVDQDHATVVITPTYSGCPAMREIAHAVVTALEARGWRASVRTVHQPAWTTAWMTDAAREKLRGYGIAPPGDRRDGDGVGAGVGAGVLVPLRRRATDAREAPAPVPCPFCGSTNTRLQSAFGSTACKALHTCGDCRQPFEEFKPI